MKYSIGEFASILGLSSDMLRLYEKYGIVRPIKDDQNHYRYFDDLDARNMLMSRWYRSFQIPLQEVSHLINNSSSDDIRVRIQEAQSNLEEEIKKSTMLLTKINEINNEFEAMESLLNQCKIKNVSGMYRIKQTNRNELLKNDFLKGVVNTWMEMLPYTFYSFRIENNDALSEKNDYLNYSWGLTVAEDELNTFDIEMDNQVEYIGPTTCVSSIIMTSNEEYIMKDSIRFMFDYVKENHYSITGDIVGKLILTENVNDESRSYLEVNIPI